MSESDKDLSYWEKNAEEDYMTTPISVLRYITELETAVEKNKEQLEKLKEFDEWKEWKNKND